MSQSIADELVAQGDALAAQLPSEINAVFAEEQAALETRELPANVVAVGDRLDDFALRDQNGQTRTLAELTARGSAVLVFYRGGWCPFCNVTLRGYQRDLLPHLGKIGAELVAISPETPDASLSTHDKDELTFTVLSDSGAALASTLGIAFQPEEAALAAQRTVGFDIRDWRDDGATVLPLPTVLVVDTEQTVRFVDIQTNYVHRTPVEPILDALALLVPAAHG
jgi:peroxiredoxin